MTYQDPSYGSGDSIIDFPMDVLAALNVDLGDLLAIEEVEGALALKPIRHADTKS